MKVVQAGRWIGLGHAQLSDKALTAKGKVVDGNTWEFSACAVKMAGKSVSGHACFPLERFSSSGLAVLLHCIFCQLKSAYKK